VTFTASLSTSAPTAASPAPFVPAPLVSTQWLADHLGTDSLVVADATVLQIAGPGGKPAYISGDEEYLVHGHVPGAVFADILETFSDPHGRHGFARPTSEQFEQAAASIGVDNDTTLVVYDNAAGQWASRIWWLFRAFGYDRVAVLDGGLKKWIAEDRPVDVGHVTARDGARFTAHERPEFWADKHAVAAIVSGESAGSLICAVPQKEFSGASGNRARAGHIPGSFSAPASRLVDRTTNAYLAPELLRQLFAEALASEARIVTYCGGGIAAASDALALALLGREDVAVYDGSLNEWAADADAPLVTTA